MLTDKQAKALKPTDKPVFDGERPPVNSALM